MYKPATIAGAMNKLRAISFFIGLRHAAESALKMGFLANGDIPVRYERTHPYLQQAKELLPVSVSIPIKICSTCLQASALY